MPPGWRRLLAPVLLLAHGWIAVACVAAPARESQSARLLADADRLFDSRDRDGALAAYQFAMVAADQEEDAGHWVEATAQIAHLHVLGGDLEAGREWIERSSERLPPDAPAARARWLIAEGALERARGQPDALSRFTEAHAIARASGLWERAIQAAYMASLVAVGEERIEWVREALDVVALAARPEWAGAIEKALARELEASGRFQEALESYRRATAKLAAQRDDVRAAMAQLGIARTLRLEGRSAEAYAELALLADGLESRYASTGSQWSAEILVRARMEEAELALADGALPRARSCWEDAVGLLRRAGLERAAPDLAAAVARRATAGSFPDRP